MRGAVVEAPLFEDDLDRAFCVPQALPLAGERKHRVEGKPDIDHAKTGLRSSTDWLGDRHAKEHDLFNGGASVHRSCCDLSAVAMRKYRLHACRGNLTRCPVVEITGRPFSV